MYLQSHCSFHFFGKKCDCGFGSIVQDGRRIYCHEYKTSIKMLKTSSVIRMIDRINFAVEIV